MIISWEMKEENISVPACYQALPGIFKLSSSG